MTSKQRATLRSYAMDLNPIINIGKGGISDNLIADVATALEAHELIKIGVLRASEFSAKELVDELVSATGAEPIQVIGSKIVLYKRSTKDGVKHVEF